jgi:uncharacterized protein YbjT (DUF2867 family)
MGEDELHVVFGTGQVGSALAGHLAGLGIAVRAVSRHRPAALAGVDWRAADAADPEAAADAVKGASVIYQCLNAPYDQWPERFPPLQRGVLAAAERTGALLVSLENLYGYGPAGGKPMTEDLPLAATGVKGRARAAMSAELLAAAGTGRVRIAIGRASDFFGPGVTEGSVLGERVFGNALAGRRADFIGNPGLLHTYSYVPDIAAGLATLGTDARAAGQCGTCPARRPAPPGRCWTWWPARSGIPSGSGRCPSWPCAPWAWSTRCCGSWPRRTTSSTSPSSWTPASTSPSSGRPVPRWPTPSPRLSPGTGPGRARHDHQTGGGKRHVSPAHPEHHPARCHQGR